MSDKIEIAFLMDIEKNFLKEKGWKESKPDWNELGFVMPTLLKETGEFLLNEAFETEKARVDYNATEDLKKSAQNLVKKYNLVQFAFTTLTMAFPMQMDFGQGQKRYQKVLFSAVTGELKKEFDKYYLDPDDYVQIVNEIRLASILGIYSAAYSTL